MTCPNGYMCFHKEGLLLVLILMIGLLVFGYSKYQENQYRQYSTNTSWNKRESLTDYPYRDPYQSNILNMDQTNIPTNDISIQDRILDRPRPIVHQQPSQFVINETPITSTTPVVPINPAPPITPIVATPPINEVSIRLQEPVRIQEPIGVPINVPTRGYVSRYEQVGILYGYGPNPQILPLYGKPTYPHSNKWLYYTQSDDYHSVRLPVLHKKRKCSGDYGCEELYDGDEVEVPPYRQKFKVNLYELNTPRYIPYI